MLHMMNDLLKIQNEMGLPQGQSRPPVQLVSWITMRLLMITVNGWASRLIIVHIIRVIPRAIG